MKIIKNIGQTLRELREHCGYSAVEVTSILAKQYNISLNYKALYNYETGRTQPNIDTFLALCIIYDCSDVLYEFGYTNDKQMHKSISSEDEKILTRYHTLPENCRNIVLGALGIEKDVLKAPKIS